MRNLAFKKGHKMDQYNLNSDDYSDKFYPLYKQYVKLRYLTIIPVLLLVGLWLKIIPSSFYSVFFVYLFVVGLINYIYPAFILVCLKCKGKLYPGIRPNFWIRFRNKKYCPNCGAKLLK